MTLLPDVDATRFAAAMRALRSIVGADWVFTSDEDLDLYRHAYTPFYGEISDAELDALARYLAKQ